MVTRTHYRIVNPLTDPADAILNGTVLSTYTAPLTYDSQTGRAASVLVTVSMKVALTDKQGNFSIRIRLMCFASQYQVCVNSQLLEEIHPHLQRLSQESPAPWSRTFWRILMRAFAQTTVS